MKQTNRPAQITAILQTVGSDYSTQVGASLEAYIAHLEVKQQLDLFGNVGHVQWDPDNPPKWSHRRAMLRQAHRQERTARNQNGYC